MFDINKEHPIFKLAYEGNLEKIKELINKSKDLLSTKTSDGCPLLFFVAAHDHLDIVKWLCDNGADLYEKDKYGNTVFHYAAAENSLDTIEWLHEQGVSLHGKITTGIPYTILLFYMDAPSLQSFCFQKEQNGMKKIMQAKQH